MPWKKSPPALVEAFDELVSGYRSAERRSMFGYPAVFLKGNMVAGLHEDRLVLRLDDETAAEAKARGARDFEPMPGRRMKGWVAVSESAVAERMHVRSWIASAFRHAGKMPAKKGRQARKPPAAKPRRR